MVVGDPLRTQVETTEEEEVAVEEEARRLKYRPKEDSHSAPLGLTEIDEENGQLREKEYQTPLNKNKLSIKTKEKEGGVKGDLEGTSGLGHGQGVGEESEGRPTITVSVTDPIKYVSDHPYIPGLTSSHYEYLVTSVFSSSVLSSEFRQVEVRRRFSDFVALADLLNENQRGYFIFPRPEKGTFDAATNGRSEADFIEYRRADLQRYLSRLCEHPVIGCGDELRVFLTAEGKLLESLEWQQLQPLRASIIEGVARLPGQLMGSETAIPNVNDVSKNARNTNDVLRMLREMGEKMRQEVSHSSIQLPEKESKLRELKAGIEGYSDTLVDLSRKSEKIVREMERFASITGDVGLSLIRLAKYEDEYGGPTGQYSEFTSTTQMLASDARRVGMMAVKMSRQERGAAERTLLSLDPIHAQLAMAPAALDALKERETAFLTLTNLQEDLRKAHASLVYLESIQNASAISDPSIAKKIESSKNDIAALQAAVQAADQGYQEIMRRNEFDYGRWKREQAQDFRLISKELSNSRGSFEQTVAEDWDTVSTDFRQDFSGHIRQ